MVANRGNPLRACNELRRRSCGQYRVVRDDVMQSKTEIEINRHGEGRATAVNMRKKVAAADPQYWADNSCNSRATTRARLGNWLAWTHVHFTTLISDPLHSLHSVLII